jgi:putative intracellular protease/amidase
MRAPRILGSLVVVLTAAMGCAPEEHAAKSTPQAATAGSCRVLVVMSDASTLTAVNAFTSSTRDFEFGYLLDEMAIPVRALLDEGCAVTFANPSATEPPRDPEGDTPAYFTDGLKGAAIASVASTVAQLTSLVAPPAAAQELDGALALVTGADSPIRGHGPGSIDTPLPLASFVGADGEALDASLAPFAAVYVPGGYGPMLLERGSSTTGLWNDPNVGAILRWFHGQARLTVTLCRGGVALRSAKQDGRPWIYDGYTMTTYSSFEDDVASVLGGVIFPWMLPFHPNEKLAEVGGVLDFAPFVPHIVDDGELLTGENQFSAHALGARFVERLRDNGALPAAAE